MFHVVSSTQHGKFKAVLNCALIGYFLLCTTWNEIPLSLLSCQVLNHVMNYAISQHVKERNKSTVFQLLKVHILQAVEVYCKGFRLPL